MAQLVHPELGARGAAILGGIVAGLVLTMLINAILAPPASTIIKLLAGGGLAYFGLKGATNRHLFMYFAGIETFLDLFRELSYPQRARALLENVQQRRVLATNVHEWFVPAGRIGFGATAARHAETPVTVERVMVPMSGGQAAGAPAYEVVKLPASTEVEVERKEETKKSVPILVT